VVKVFTVLALVLSVLLACAEDGKTIVSLITAADIAWEEIVETKSTGAF